MVTECHVTSDTEKVAAKFINNNNGERPHSCERSKYAFSFRLKHTVRCTCLPTACFVGCGLTTFNKVLLDWLDLMYFDRMHSSAVAKWAASQCIASDAAYCYTRSVVCLSVCLLVTSVSRAKTDEPIEKPFGGVNSWGPRNHVWPDPTTERDTFGRG